MADTPTISWRKLATAAAKETDTNKLIELVHQLCDSLDRSDERVTVLESEKARGEVAKVD
jgi:hypothetical protein